MAGTTEIIKVEATVMPTTEELLNEALLKQKLEELEAEHSGNLEQCRAIKVSDRRSQAAAIDLLHKLEPLARKLDKARSRMGTACRERVNSIFGPVLSRFQEAARRGDQQVKEYDARQQEIARQATEEAEKKAAEERAELERRRKIQEAALSQGKQKRTEIAAPESVAPEQVNLPAALAEDSRQHFRLDYELVNLEAIPMEYITKIVNAGVLRAKITELEKTYDKKRRGLDEPEQVIPGIRLVWKSIRRYA